MLTKEEKYLREIAKGLESFARSTESIAELSKEIKKDLHIIASNMQVKCSGACSGMLIDADKTLKEIDQMLLKKLDKPSYKEDKLEKLVRKKQGIISQIGNAKFEKLSLALDKVCAEVSVDPADLQWFTEYYRLEKLIPTERR